MYFVIKTYIYFLGCLCISMLISCSSEIEKPRMQSDSKVYDIEKFNISFIAQGEEWAAYLQTYRQPVPLLLTKSSEGFSLQFLKEDTPTAGSAIICLSNGDSTFFFPIELIEKSKLPKKNVDFRSPKTLNPDSILVHQKIVYFIDTKRQVVPLHTDRYYQESLLAQKPKVAKIRAIPSSSLSTFYIQAGSCVKIPIVGATNNLQQTYDIKVGPLIDKSQNFIADGTLVRIHYTENEQIFTREIVSLNGYANTSLPINDFPKVVFAQINDLTSQEIKLP